MATIQHISSTQFKGERSPGLQVQVTVIGLNHRHTFTGFFPSTCDAILNAMDAHEWALSASAKTVATKDAHASLVRKSWHILPLMDASHANNSWFFKDECDE